MPGTGGLPPNFLPFHFSHEYFRGEPPVPLTGSLLSFSTLFLLSKKIMNNDNE